MCEYLTALCFPDGRDYAKYIPDLKKDAPPAAASTHIFAPRMSDSSAPSEPCAAAVEAKDLPIFAETFRWLDLYFQGKNPDFTPRYRRPGETPFRRAVAAEMLKIPYGETRTYGDIAKNIATQRGLSKMSAQAVGGAVGWNPICIIVPCHRVVGANKSLTGYGGGMKNKVALLKLEGIDLGQYTIPTHGTAL